MSFLATDSVSSDFCQIEDGTANVQSQDEFTSRNIQVMTFFVLLVLLRPQSGSPVDPRHTPGTSVFSDLLAIGHKECAGPCAATGVQL